MGRKIAMPKLDIVFKKAFTEPVDSITNIQIVKNELVPETADGKFSRLDLTIELDGSLVNVEIQLTVKR